MPQSYFSALLGLKKMRLFSFPFSFSTWSAKEEGKKTRYRRFWFFLHSWSILYISLFLCSLGEGQEMVVEYFAPLPPFSGPFAPVQPPFLYVDKAHFF